MLSDSLIRKYVFGDRSIVIDPLPEDSQIQPCSVDLRLNLKGLHSEEVVVTSYAPNGGIEAYHREIKKNPFCDDCESKVMGPGCFNLASTLEHIELPNDIAARVEGKSSLARRGLMVHVTAGFIDPGFRGNITLELKNVSRTNIELEEGMLISQICFFRVEGRVLRPYGSNGLGSHYQDSVGTVEAK